VRVRVCTCASAKKDFLAKVFSAMPNTQEKNERMWLPNEDVEEPKGVQKH
jgi:hypothetical protein